MHPSGESGAAKRQTNILEDTSEAEELCASSKWATSLISILDRDANICNEEIWMCTPQELSQFEDDDYRNLITSLHGLIDASGKYVCRLSERVGFKPLMKRDQRVQKLISDLVQTQGNMVNLYHLMDTCEKLRKLQRIQTYKELRNSLAYEWNEYKLSVRQIDERSEIIYRIDTPGYVKPIRKRWTGFSA